MKLKLENTKLNSNILFNSNILSISSLSCYISSSVCSFLKLGTTQGTFSRYNVNISTRLLFR